VQQHLRHDVRLRAAVREIYDAVYPGEEWNGAVPFEQAERCETVHYRQACEAALRVRPVLADRAEQLALI
jgi:hypothetical protein